ncbi:hypothetical protein N7478_005552 [Penicillium angulare]|uniref:uncharacterized protein n=1 Tax=Penicillium angulare TaxID=116970 RepID=UPI00254122A3|nr:uncharacterized protein N7478_005552 [Penicillium angulare]KAJ5280180.1 hypothetical protein N7478_005552 [Penicillium angulare]
MVKPDKPKKGQIPFDQLPIEKRLTIQKYDADDCKDAIHGRRIPKAFGHEVHRLCIIRGIRYHHGFAEELRGVTPEFTRALNARDIMSGVIPTFSEPDRSDIPYCIWHPDVPSEDTLRLLVQRYPDMIYHAARACAVGGYIDLYKELDILPEVHIAEEAGYAQRNRKGSQEIYQNILSQPVKFAIMNDYKRTVDVSGRRVTPLNGDTAAYSSLEAKSTFHESKGPWVHKSYYFNITEDWGIDDHDCEAPKTPDDDFPLVYSPLPTDLPLINKDGLISVAAYIGDIDRYVRLRRPEWIEDELGLVVHGIYHNAFFAKWWNSQISETPQSGLIECTIRRAINARRIMSNDLSWVTVDVPDLVLPEMIYYPSFAQGTTYQELAHIVPSMYRLCLQACIGAGYVTTWDNLLLQPPEDISYFQSPRKPDEPEDLKLWRISRVVGADIWNEAQLASNPQFLQEISAAVPKKPDSGPDWQDYCSAFGLYHRIPEGVIRVDKPIWPSGGIGPYNGQRPGIGDVDYAAFVMDAVGKDVWEEEKQRQNSSYLPVDRIYEFLKTNRASK